MQLNPFLLLALIFVACILVTQAKPLSGDNEKGEENQRLMREAEEEETSEADETKTEDQQTQENNESSEKEIQNEEEGELTPEYSNKEDLSDELEESSDDKETSSDRILNSSEEENSSEPDLSEKDENGESPENEDNEQTTKRWLHGGWGDGFAGWGGGFGGWGGHHGVGPFGVGYGYGGPSHEPWGAGLGWPGFWYKSKVPKDSESASKRGILKGYAYSPYLARDLYYRGASFRSQIPGWQRTRRGNALRRWGIPGIPAGFGYPGWGYYGHPGLGFWPGCGIGVPVGGCFRSAVPKGDETRIWWLWM